MEPVESEATPAIEAKLQKSKLPDEPWEQTLTRWRRSLPDWKAVVAVMILPLAVWWFWPVSYGDIGATYRSMYQELRELRDRPNDKTGMEEFVERSQARLDILVPWLQKRASSNKPELQWLLWMGRDCLSPMLKNPRIRDSKPETTFVKLLAQWEQLHQLKPVTDRTGPQSSSDDEQRSSPSAARTPASGKIPSRSPPTNGDSATDQ